MSKLDPSDLDAIKQLVEVTVDEVIEKKELVTRDDLKHLPTKDDFYSKMDEVMGELRTIREEQTMQSQHIADHDARIHKIETHLGFSTN